MSGFAVRPLRKDELAVVMQWMVAETWHISENILKACYLLDPSGWIAAEDYNTGQVIGTITGCCLNEDTAFGGFFIVRPDWRRRGVGKALWAARMSYLGHRNFGIDAVEARVKYDMENGFKHTSFGVAAFLGCIDRNKIKPKSKAVTIKPFCGDSKMQSEMLAYDSKTHKIPRPKFFKQWIDLKFTKSFTAYNDHGDITGFGCAQPIEGGHFHVGPIFADNPEIAWELYSAICHSIPEGIKIGCDVPLNNSLSVNIARDNGMTEELKLYRMYTKNNMEFDTDKVFAFTTMGIALV